MKKKILTIALVLTIGSYGLAESPGGTVPRPGPAPAPTAPAVTTLSAQVMMNQIALSRYVAQYVEGDHFVPAAAKSWYSDSVGGELQWTSWSGLSIAPVKKPYALFATLGDMYAYSGASVQLPAPESSTPGVPVLIKLVDDALLDSAEMIIYVRLSSKISVKYLSLRKAGQWVVLASDGQRWIVLAESSDAAK